MCLNDIHPTHVRVHDFGQFLARHYGGPQLQQQVALVKGLEAPPLLPPAVQTQRPAQTPRGQQQQPRQPALLPPVSIIRQLGVQPQLAQRQHGKELQLRVLFSKRSSADRRLLNSAELLRRCNAWRHTAQSGARLRAFCWEVRREACRVAEQAQACELLDTCPPACLPMCAPDSDCVFAGVGGAARSMLALRLLCGLSLSRQLTNAQAETPSLEAGIAAAQQADVLIGEGLALQQ